MTTAILVPCLVALRTEFNKRYPFRDKGADGWIGDAAHQQESSDHNGDESGRTPSEDADHVDEVHALDVDANLIPGPAGPKALRADVERIRLNHLHGDDSRLQNVIYQGQIASRSWGWGWRPYDGPSKHFDHAHFSARYTTAAESDTSPWGVAPVEVTLSKADKDDIVKRAVDGVADRLALSKLGDRTLGGSVNALVTPSTDSGAVPNIITREVQPIVDAAVDRILAGGPDSPPANP